MRIIVHWGLCWGPFTFGRVSGLGFEVYGLGFRAEGLGVGVWGLWLRV